MLRQVVGAPARTADRLEADLGLDSLEVAALATGLRARFGDRVRLPDLLASLELDRLIDLTAADVAGYVADRVSQVSR